MCFRRKKKAPEQPAVVETAEVVEEKSGIVNCPKCSTALRVKVDNNAYLCPVCSNVFRTRISHKLVKDISSKTMVEAFVTVDRDSNGAVRTGSVVSDLDK